jgi:hypothetical protein
VSVSGEVAARSVPAETFYMAKSNWLILRRRHPRFVPQ